MVRIRFWISAGVETKMMVREDEGNGPGAGSVRGEGEWDYPRNLRGSVGRGDPEAPRGSRTTTLRRAFPAVSSIAVL